MSEMNIVNSENPSLRVKSKLVGILCALVLLMPCLSYVLLADAPAIAMMAGSFLGIAIAQRQGFLISKRSVIYSLTISFFIAVILNEVYPVDADRFFIPLPTEILFPFIITLGVCACFHVQRPVVLIVILTISVSAMMLQGSCIMDPKNSRFEISSLLWSNRFWVFGFFLFLQLLAFIPLLFFSQPENDQSTYDSDLLGRRFKLQGFSLLLFFAMIGILSFSAQRLEHALEPFFNHVFNVYMDRFKAKIIFEKEVDLYRKSSPEVIQGSERIILRAISRGTPGYLRGRVYSRYSKGKWLLDDRQTPYDLVSEIEDSTLAVKKFYQGKAVDIQKIMPAMTVDIIPTRNFYSDVLLANGNRISLELIAQKVVSTQDGILSPVDWMKDGGYTINNETIATMAAYNDGNPLARDSDYLKIDDSELEKVLNDISLKLFPAVESSVPGRDRIKALENFFESEFSYSLGTRPESIDRDPVIEFLAKTKKGHCELFATATALLLRQQGIPARYVTGFVCMEPDSKNNFWLARLGDCHAWVEAWIPEEQQWMVVENTPAQGIPDGERRSSLWKQGWEFFAGGMAQVYMQVKRGYFAKAVIAFFSGISDFFIWLFWSGPWYLKLGSVVTLIICLFGILKRRQRQMYGGHISKPLSHLHQQLYRIEKGLKKRRVYRHSSTTISELIDALKQHPNFHGRDEAINLLNQYQSLRYRSTCLSEVKLDEFEKEVGLWRRKSRLLWPVL